MKPPEIEDEARISGAFPGRSATGRGLDLWTEGGHTPSLPARDRTEHWNGAPEVGGCSGPVQSSVFQEQSSPADRRSQTWRLPGGFVLDPGSRGLSRDGVRSALTHREFALLELLASQPGRVFTRTEIIAGVWAGKARVQPRVIDVHVRAIRRKTGPQVIETSRCAGYRLGAVT
ncbi:hypothetical protein DAETH_45750 (plasmid) [Deinococcus aetherius]|uniref:OmpR/PhoB-type domain-containing protein n=1 Tax=Deinococcus aetherius TaxID=200252 RepID=A0ABN6RRS3_9DEIO|nr:winged helix-turn-helix domain-containing protein [Deinococcus aetherius]BDP44606.1 hypothetical protein DAETH_45750 [Deinococcus aetherius]